VGTFQFLLELKSLVFIVKKPSHFSSDWHVFGVENTNAVLTQAFVSISD
jgi:hypothetical protein